MLHVVVTMISLMAGDAQAMTLDGLSAALRADQATAASWSVMFQGRQERFVLEPWTVLTPDAQVIVQGDDGVRQADLGQLRMWSGHLARDAESRVFIAASAHGLNGWIVADDVTWVLSDDRGTGPVTVADARTLDGVLPPSCQVRAPEGVPAPVRGQAVRGEFPPCRVAVLAIDTDAEFTIDTFGGDADAAAAYAVTLAGGSSQIFFDDIRTRFEVDFVRVWDTEDDPYGQGGDLLDEFRNEWRSNMTHIERSVAHIFSGRTDLPYGGVAWLSVVCNDDWGYAVSGYLSGSFPQPIEDDHPDNWDLLVVSHELGHNFGTLHTHDGFSPPIDNCGNGDCTGAENGTIMSYCHICEGGVSNIEMGFHPLVQETMLAYLDSIEPDCDLRVTEGEGMAIDDHAVTFQDVAVHVDALVNDEASDCVGGFMPDIATFDEVTSQGGTVSLIDGEEGVLDVLVYTPAVGFLGEDDFTYTLAEGGTATVIVEVLYLRPPDTPGALEAGAKIDYYDIGDQTQLPVYAGLTPYASDVLPDVNLASSNGEFATSGMADHVGAVVTGFVQVPAPGIYTLSVESDDGSRLFIGESLVADNDGIHGMVEVGGLIGLQAGRHEIRVEFFERTGGAGLIVWIEGPGLGHQPIPAGAWSHQDGEVPECAEDVNGDGAIDVNDILQVIGQWGDCGTDCASDVDGDGTVGVDDVLAILSAWGSDC